MGFELRWTIYTAKEGVAPLCYTLLQKNAKKLQIIYLHDREIVGMVVHFGIAGQVRFGSADLDAYLLMRRLYLLQKVRYHALFDFVSPLPSAVPTLDAYSSPTDGQAVDECSKSIKIFLCPVQYL